MFTLLPLVVGGEVKMDSLFWMESLSLARQARRTRFEWVRRMAVVLVLLFVLGVLLTGNRS